MATLCAQAYDGQVMVGFAFILMYVCPCATCVQEPVDVEFRWLTGAGPLEERRVLLATEPCLRPRAEYC